MKFIQKLCFAGETAQAAAVYKRAFGCTEKCLLRYSDAVQNGWEQPDAAKNDLIYHSEWMFGGQEVRMDDLSGPEEAELTRRVAHHVAFDTEGEVRSAFEALSEGGTVLRPLESPPYLVIIGEVRDRFGVRWVLICDYR